jgi:hypothetical protein
VFCGKQGRDFASQLIHGREDAIFRTTIQAYKEINSQIRGDDEKK